jgi:polyferredoxin
LNGIGFIKLTQALFAFAIVAGFAIGIFSIFFGRRFCGYICPLGTMQEAIYRFDRKRCYKKNKLPYYLEKRLRLIKYLVLCLTAIMAFRGLGYLYMSACPVMSISKLPILGLRGAIVLLIIVIGGFFVERLWCRFLCPYAALLNIFQWLGKLFGIKRRMIYRNIEKCNECGVCSAYCPMNVNILENEYVEDANCIYCHMCVGVCPKKGVSEA